MINNPTINKFFKDFPNHRKKTKRVAVFRNRPFPNILKYKGHQWHLSNNLENKLFESRFVMIFLTILGVTKILCSFRLVLEGKTGKEIPK